MKPNHRVDIDLGKPARSYKETEADKDRREAKRRYDETQARLEEERINREAMGVGL